MEEDARNNIGTKPFGLPLNAEIREKLPALFEVDSHQGELVIGANPWHFITKTSPTHLEVNFICWSFVILKNITSQIRNLQTKELVTTVEFSRHFAGMEVEHMFFHPDDSKRSIHVCNNKLRFDHFLQGQLFIFGDP